MLYANNIHAAFIFKAFNITLSVCVSLKHIFCNLKKKLRLFKYLVKERMTAGKPAHLCGTAAPEYS